MKPSRLVLSTRLLLIAAATFLALLTTFAAILVSERSSLVDSRREKLRNLVEVAHAVVGGYETASREGRINPEDARKAAAEALRGLRYDGAEYFWIHDLTRPSARMIMHPTVPALESKVLDAATFNRASAAQAGMDGPRERLDGKNLFVAFNDVVDRAGHGFVEYAWPRPKAGNAATDEFYPKLSYVKKFEPWGWVIGTGVYIDDIDAAFRASAVRLLGVGLLLSGAVVLPLVFLRRYLLNLLGGEPRLAVEASMRIAAGDLVTSVPVRADDHASLLAAIKRMQGDLCSIIARIRVEAENVARDAGDLRGSSEQARLRSQEQNDASQAIASAVEQMSTSIDRISQSAGEAHRIAGESREHANDGDSVIQRVAGEIEQLSSMVNDAAGHICELESHSAEISSIVKVIKAIADQTNLLALNAAIEAARAGEQGRGFAVVADEVRRLAERTTAATAEIARTIDRIQQRTHSAVDSMHQGVERAAEGVTLAKQAAESIGRIRCGTERVTDMVTEISAAIREESEASGEIASRIGEIARMTELGTEEVVRTADAARDLEGTSQKLRESMARFNLA